MSEKLSPRLRKIVDALPLKPGMRVLEIGCGPGAMAREILERVGDNGFVLGVDRSEKAIAMAKSASRTEIKKGKIQFQVSEAEAFELGKTEKRFDLVVAIRVGVFDGRYPEEGIEALKRVKAALKPRGKFFIDGGNPLKEVVFKK